jgi:hypothetical protein
MHGYGYGCLTYQRTTRFEQQEGGMERVNQSLEGQFWTGLRQDLCGKKQETECVVYMCE